MQEQIKRGKGRPKGKTVSKITVSLSNATLSIISELPYEDRLAVILKAIDTMESIQIGRKKRSLGRCSVMVCYTVPIEYSERFSSYEARSFRFEQALTKIIDG